MEQLPLGRFENIIKSNVILIKIISVFFLEVILGGFIIANTSETGFSTYYYIILLDICIIWYFNSSYPRISFSSINLSKTLVYGLSLGSIIPAILLMFHYFDLNIVSSDYGTFQSYNYFERIIWIINMTTITPVVEELLFRGSFYRILRDRYGLFFAVLLSNLFFAFVHKNNIASFIVVFMKGLLLTYAYEKSRSVWANIIIHSLNNITTVLIFVYYV